MFNSYNLHMVLLFFFFPTITNLPFLAMMGGGFFSFDMPKSNTKTNIFFTFATSILYVYNIFD